MRKLSTTHKLNIGLSLIAFGLFVVNQFKALSGSVLDLNGMSGALLLTAFLAAGIVVQFAKLIEGHGHIPELAITIILLVAHIAAELTIWYRTQIIAATLPHDLPLYIVGLYWLVGATDLLIIYLPENIRRFSSTYVSPEDQIAELQKRLVISEKDNESLGDTIEDLRETIKKRDATIEQAHREARAAVEEANRKHEWTCPDCGKFIEHDSKSSLERAKTVHLTQWCPKKEHNDD